MKTPILNRIFIVLLYLPARIYVYCEYSLLYAWRRLVGEGVVRALPDKGVGCRIHGVGRITCRKSLRLGRYVHIGEGYYLHTEGGLVIGDGTIISRDVTIYTANHMIAADCLPFGDGYAYKKVTIGRGVWIGMGASILPGVTVGDGAVIGLGTIVAEDVPAGTYYVGAKGRRAKSRTDDGWQECVELGKYYGRRNAR